MYFLRSFIPVNPVELSYAFFPFPKLNVESILYKVIRFELQLSKKHTKKYPIIVRIFVGCLLLSVIIMNILLFLQMRTSGSQKSKQIADDLPVVYLRSLRVELRYFTGRIGWDRTGSAIRIRLKGEFFLEISLVKWIIISTRLYVFISVLINQNIWHLIVDWTKYASHHMLWMILASSLNMSYETDIWFLHTDMHLAHMECWQT